MNFCYGVIVDGRRDHYQVQLALHEQGALQTGFTDFYTPDWIALIASKFPIPGRHRLLSRRCQGLSSGKMTALFPKHHLRTAWLKRRRVEPEDIYSVQHEMLAKRAAEYAKVHPDMGMVCYSYYLAALARQRRLWRGPSIVFQVHPIGPQIRRVLEEDRAKTGLSYLPEPEELASSAEDNRYIQILRIADGIITASSFTRDGLVSAGVAPEDIAIVPYGGACARTSENAEQRKDHWEKQQPLRLLWVGQLAYRKAPHHLFDAVARFPTQVRLSVVTQTALDPELAQHVPANVRFYNSVDNSQLREMYRSHHLFVLPSLVEGFGLVYLEAMSEGLPILCTSNTGGPDVMKDGLEGFVVPPGDSCAIAGIIEQCLATPGLLPQMSIAARACARIRSWPRFRQGIREAICGFEQRKSKKASHATSL